MTNRLLRSRMRRLVVSAGFDADHREHPSCDQRSADIAQSMCAHDQSSANRTSVCPASMPRTLISASE